MLPLSLVYYSKSLTCKSISYLNSLAYFEYFLEVARISPRALVYLVVSKISSKIFLRFAWSEKGHRDSSWWQKITYSRIAFETPINIGT